MRKLLLLSGLLPCLLLVAGCPKKGDDAADAAAEAAATTGADAAPAAAAVIAKNTTDVARFGSETKIDNEAAVILAPSALVRTSPKSGTVVTTLKTGTAVTKLASAQDWFLIAFLDPKDGTTNLMGWVDKVSFVAVAVVVVVDAGFHDAGPPPPCAAGQQQVKIGVSPVCKKACKADSECKTGPCSAAATLKGTTVKVCATDP